MTVLELCSFIRNPKHQEAILYVADSEDNEVVFKGSAYDAVVSDFANCEVVNFRPMNYTIIVQLLT
jgi:hypothetical protein